MSGTVDDRIPISWGAFQSDAESERGLFKILYLSLQTAYRTSIQAHFERTWMCRSRADSRPAWISLL